MYGYIAWRISAILVLPIFSYHVILVMSDVYVFFSCKTAHQDFAAPEFLMARVYVFLHYLIFNYRQRARIRVFYSAKLEHLVSAAECRDESALNRACNGRNYCLFYRVTVKRETVDDLKSNRIFLDGGLDDRRQLHPVVFILTEHCSIVDVLQ